MIWFSVVQMLWDRSEANGYAEHITDDPYPDTPRHQVLMQVAFGDHQVANVTAEVEARTIGARILLPGLLPGRSPDVVPFWGITPISFLPWNGSAIVYWDSRNARPAARQRRADRPRVRQGPARVPRRSHAQRSSRSPTSSGPVARWSTSAAVCPASLRPPEPHGRVRSGHASRGGAAVLHAGQGPEPRRRGEARGRSGRRGRGAGRAARAVQPVGQRGGAPRGRRAPRRAVASPGRASSRDRPGSRSSRAASSSAASAAPSTCTTRRA